MALTGRLVPVIIPAGKKALEARRASEGGSPALADAAGFQGLLSCRGKKLLLALALLGLKVCSRVCRLVKQQVVPIGFDVEWHATLSALAADWKRAKSVRH